jgi:hypothetical protein
MRTLTDIFSVNSEQLLASEGKRQKAKERIWQFFYLKVRLETKYIKAFSLIN